MAFKLRMLVWAIASAAASVVGATTITVDRAVSLGDTCVGFGASGAMHAWSEAGPWHDAQFLDAAVDDLGLTIIRTDIPTDFEPQNSDTLSPTLNWSDYNLTGEIAKRFDYLRALKQACDSNGRPLKVLATVFSPPAWMKTNADVNNGGSLRPTLYDHFAKYCEAYVRAVHDSTGVDVYCLSLQNQPSFSWPSPSCVYTGAQLGDLVKRAGVRFRSEGLTTRITFTDDFINYTGPAVLGPMVQDSATRAEAAFLSVHIDGSTYNAGMAGLWANMASNAASVGKNVWMTNVWGSTDGWANSWILARSMYAALVYGHVSAWIYGQLGASSGSGTAALFSDGVSTTRYHVTKSFSAFIGPGSISVGTSGPATVGATAWHHLGDSNLTVVLLNLGASSLNVSLSVPDSVSPREYRVYRTSQSENCVSLGTLAATDSIALPQQSVTTFVGRDSVPVGTNIAPVITNTPDSIAVQTGATATWVARATDSNGDPVTFTFDITVAYVQQTDDSTLTISPLAGDLSTVVQVIASDGNGGADTLDLRVIVEPAVGVNKPRVSHLNARAHDERAYEVYDHSGRLVMRLVGSLGPSKLEPKVPTGCYVLRDVSSGETQPYLVK